MDDFRKKLGANMRKARHHQGLTQEEVAASIDIPTDVYGRMEQGSMIPRLELFVTLCSRLGVTSDQLLGFAPFRPTEEDG
jgi:transcriptional regulator with XRE-family HTH domain